MEQKRKHILFRVITILILTSFTLQQASFADISYKIAYDALSTGNIGDGQTPNVDEVDKVAMATRLLQEAGVLAAVDEATHATDPQTAKSVLIDFCAGRMAQEAEALRILSGCLGEDRSTAQILIARASPIRDQVAQAGESGVDLGMSTDGGEEDAAVVYDLSDIESIHAVELMAVLDSAASEVEIALEIDESFADLFGRTDVTIPDILACLNETPQDEEAVARKLQEVMDRRIGRIESTTFAEELQQTIVTEQLESPAEIARRAQQLAGPAHQSLVDALETVATTDYSPFAPQQLSAEAKRLAGNFGLDVQEEAVIRVCLGLDAIDLGMSTDGGETEFRFSPDDPAITQATDRLDAVLNNAGATEGMCVEPLLGLLALSAKLKEVPPRMIDVFINALASKHPKVRMGAISALDRWRKQNKLGDKGTQVVESLKARSEAEEDPVVKRVIATATRNLPADDSTDLGMTRLGGEETMVVYDTSVLKSIDEIDLILSLETVLEETSSGTESLEFDELEILITLRSGTVSMTQLLTCLKQAPQNSDAVAKQLQRVMDKKFDRIDMLADGGWGARQDAAATNMHRNFNNGTHLLMLTAAHEARKDKIVREGNEVLIVRECLTPAQEAAINQSDSTDIRIVSRDEAIAAAANPDNAERRIILTPNELGVTDETAQCRILVLHNYHHLHLPATMEFARSVLIDMIDTERATIMGEFFSAVMQRPMTMADIGMLSNRIVHLPLPVVEENRLDDINGLIEEHLAFLRNA